MIALDLLYSKTGKTSWQRLLEYTRENTVSFILYDTAGRVRYVAPFLLGADELNLDYNVILSNGWEWDYIKQENPKWNCVSNSYWTCKCKSDFMHHKMNKWCSVCKTEMGSQQRFPSIESRMLTIFSWEPMR